MFLWQLGLEQGVGPFEPVPPVRADCSVRPVANPVRLERPAFSSVAGLAGRLLSDRLAAGVAVAISDPHSISCGVRAAKSPPHPLGTA